MEWMKGDSTERVRLLLNVLAGVVCALLLIMGSAKAQNGDIVSEHATGTFEVKLAPEAVAGKTADPSLGQMSIDKTFHGDLEATSAGSMLTAGTAIKGSAAYVAIEKVTGKLKGHAGSFVLIHNATMTRGEGALSVTVVPDSGTDALAGLTGKMTIRIEAGKHYYDFDYTLPAKAD